MTLDHVWTPSLIYGVSGGFRREDSIVNPEPHVRIQDADFERDRPPSYWLKEQLFLSSNASMSFWLLLKIMS